MSPAPKNSAARRPEPEPVEWRPGATRARLRRRAELLARIRAFFAARDVLEVETPVLSRTILREPHLEAMTVGAGADRPMYLQASPEAAMKRLLCAGSGSIYQITRAFRAGESGARHNPEFTLLEWYRVGFDHHALMAEVDDLLRAALDGWVQVGAAEYLTYRAAFERIAGVDPHRADVAALARCAAAHGLDTGAGAPQWSRDQWLDWLFGAVVGPALGADGPCFVYDFPASQAAFARIRAGDPPLAERFEVFLRGIELANGYHELDDAGEMHRRLGPGADARTLEALRAGLPACAGVALGVDRLALIAAGAQSLDEVMAFSWARC